MNMEWIYVVQQMLRIKDNNGEQPQFLTQSQNIETDDNL